MYRVSEEFHEKYFAMYDHMVRIFLKMEQRKLDYSMMNFMRIVLYWLAVK